MPAVNSEKTITSGNPESTCPSTISEPAMLSRHHDEMTMSKADITMALMYLFLKRENTLSKIGVTVWGVEF